MIKLIIFDYDGVILNSFPAIHRVYLKICKTIGVSCPEDLDTFRSVYGRNYKELLSNLGVKGESTIQKAEKIYAEEIQTQVYDAYPDIGKVLRQLHQRYKLIALSANYESEVRRNLELNNLTQFFDNIVGKKDTTRFIKKKVVPDILDAYNVTTQEVIAVGDRNVDYEMAQENGIRNFILAGYGWGYDESTIDPRTPIAHTTNDILVIVNKIDSQ